MPDNLLTFQKFNDPELANSMCDLLQSQGIDCKVVNEAPKFDVSFAYNKFEPTFHLKVPPDEFLRARAALELYYQQQLNTLDTDYYLFYFSDADLLDLVQHPDEWGALDYALARQLLANHGTPITVEQEESFKRQRLEVLSQPESSHPYWIFFGYLAVIAGSLFGFFIGYVFAFLQKTLPDGNRVFVYSPRERRHGRRILVMSAIVLPFWLWYFLSGDFFSAPWAHPK